MMIIGYSTAAAAAPGALSVVRVEAYSDGDSANTQSRLVVPSGVAAGNTLVAVMRTVINTTAAPPPGWTQVATNTGTGSAQLFVFRKVADGTEGDATLTWTLGASRKSCFVLAEIRGAAGVVEATFAGTLDPPAHAASGGPAETAWLAVSSPLRTDSAADAAPAGYAGFAFAESAANSSSNQDCSIAGACRIGTASAEDPGPFNWSGSLGSGPLSATISVR
jgi:hypothetical protein